MKKRVFSIIFLMFLSLFIFTNNIKASSVPPYFLVPELEEGYEWVFSTNKTGSIKESYIENYSFDNEFMENITFYTYEDNTWVLQFQNGNAINNDFEKHYSDENMVYYKSTVDEYVGVNYKKWNLPAQNYVIQKNNQHFLFKFPSSYNTSKSDYYPLMITSHNPVIQPVYLSYQRLKNISIIGYKAFHDDYFQEGMLFFNGNVQGGYEDRFLWEEKEGYFIFRVLDIWDGEIEIVKTNNLYFVYENNTYIEDLDEIYHKNFIISDAYSNQEMFLIFSPEIEEVEDLNFSYAVNLFWTNQYTDEYYLATDEFDGMPYSIPAIADFSLTAIVGDIVAYNGVNAIYPGHTEPYAYYVFMVEEEELHFYNYKLQLRDVIPFDELVNVTTDLDYPYGTYEDGFYDGVQEGQATGYDSGYRDGYDDSSTATSIYLENMMKYHRWLPVKNERESFWKTLNPNKDYFIELSSKRYGEDFYPEAVLYPSDTYYYGFDYSTGVLTVIDEDEFNYPYFEDGWGTPLQTIQLEKNDDRYEIQIKGDVNIKMDHNTNKYINPANYPGDDVFLVFSYHPEKSFPYEFKLVVNNEVLDGYSYAGNPNYPNHYFSVLEPEILTHTFWINQSYYDVVALKGDKIKPLYHEPPNNMMFVGWKDNFTGEIFDFDQPIMSKVWFNPVFASTLPPFNEDDYDWLIVDTSMIDENEVFDVSTLGYDFDYEFMETITFYIWDNDSEDWVLSVELGLSILQGFWSDYGNEEIKTYFHEGVGININHQLVPEKNIISMKNDSVTTAFKIAIPKVAEVESYTIDFYIGEELYATKTVEENETIVLPLTPEGEEGQVFLGWYYEEDFETQFKITDPINEDLTLYGKFGPSGGTTPTHEDPITSGTFKKEYIIYIVLGVLAIGLITFYLKGNKKTTKKRK